MYIIFVASLNENMKLAKKVEEQLKQEGKTSEIINLVELNLPMYDSLKEEKDGIPNGILDLISKMQETQGYIFVSPEYNFSLPPVLVNFIAWVSRADEDFRKVFTLKPIQLAVHAGGGGSDVSAAMRNQFTRLGALVMPREIIATYQKPIEDGSLKRILEQFIQISTNK
ncbi:MAG: NADPH-dependent FMN reductase [Arcobacter sp.]|nr:MAG: NADPH-dependent FMN reductase [Arcobacter sp.]